MERHGAGHHRQRAVGAPALPGARLRNRSAGDCARRAPVDLAVELPFVAEMGGASAAGREQPAVSTANTTAPNAQPGVCRAFLRIGCLFVIGPRRHTAAAGDVSRRRKGRGRPSARDLSCTPGSWRSRGRRAGRRCRRSPGRPAPCTTATCCPGSGRSD
jgi:hypothetical protein